MDSRLSRLAAAGVAMGLSLATGAAVAAQRQTEPRQRALTIESLAGRDTFEFYCAPCHGPDGRGQGPVAAALSTTPPDLTMLSYRRGGTFPSKEIREFLTGTGRPIVAHGPGTMPIWGPTFQALDPSDRRVRIRIANVVTYVESIQSTSPGATAEKGAR